MTPDTLIPSKTARGPTSRRRTIFSIMGIALVACILFTGFAAAAVTDNTQLNSIFTTKYLSTHRVNCLSDTQQFPPIMVICPNSGGYGFNYDLDRTACIATYGTSVTRVIQGICLAQ
jgi:hypothetical protein